MALPLAVRKDIRDKEPKIQEAKKKIDAALGFEVTIDINNEEVHKVLTEAGHSRKEAFTEPLSQYLDNLSQQLATITKDPQVKEELTKAISAKKISVVVQKDPLPSKEPERGNLGGNTYVGVEFKDGALRVIIPQNCFWSNISNISNPKEVSIIGVISKTLTPAGTLPLHMRVAMKAAEPKFQEAVKKISTAVGFEVTLDFDVYAAYTALGENKDRIPDAVPQYISGLGDNLAKICKDDMIKEALLEKFTTKKIKVQIHNGAFPNKDLFGGDSYVGLSFAGGDMAIVIPSNCWWCNMSNIASLKIEKIL